MKSIFGATMLAAATLTFTPVLAQASAYQSATFVSEATAGGDYYLDNTRYLGAVFSVTANESLTSIGGNFTVNGDGNAIFGAVVRLTSADTLPAISDLAASTVSEALFTPTGGDQSVALTGTLTAGKYAVLFGSGLFGATGASGLVASQNPVGTPTFVQYADNGSGVLAADTFNFDTLRVTLNTVAAPVPEPESFALAAVSLLLLGGQSLRNRRQ